MRKHIMRRIMKRKKLITSIDNCGPMVGYIEKSTNLIIGDNVRSKVSIENFMEAKKQKNN